MGAPLDPAAGKPGGNGEWKYVFGPVTSRRLGESLGVDPIPTKTCNWNCVYCQLGRTTPLCPDRGPYVPAGAILSEVEAALADRIPGEIEWITFVGSGEPLLNEGLGAMIRGVKARTTIPVAVITNGSLLSREDVRDALSPADAVLPTLDGGNASLFRRINRPHPRFTFQDHLRGLEAFRAGFGGRLLLEVMLLKGMNDSEEALGEIARCVEMVSPDEVHVSLPERPPAEPWVQPADQAGILRAAAILGKVARVLQPGETVLVLEDAGTALDTILRVIRRHPLSADQLNRALAGHPPSVRAEILTNLEQCGKARPVRRHGSVFWVSPRARFPDSGKAGK